MFRAVFKRDREGYILDAGGDRVRDVTPAKLKQSVEYRDNAATETTPPPAGVPVHLKDIHLEKGMHCVDCHFQQDAHGNGILYNEPRAAIEIDCIDCHGMVKQTANLTASTFPSVAQAAQRARLPVFAFLSGLSDQGAAVCLSRDYYDMGHDAGLLAARVMRGATRKLRPLPR